MKKLLLTAMVMGAFLFNYESKAQVRVGVNINIGNTPTWGVPGNYTGGYYYMPEIDAYYDIPRRQFIYFQGNDWVFANSLPYAYRNYDLARGYKVVINEPRPYLHHDMYRVRYNNYYANYHKNNRIVYRQDGYDRRFDNRYDNRRDNDRYDGRGRNDRDDWGKNKDKNDRNDRNDRNDHDNGRRGKG
jgi:hypothetical protein